MSDSFGSTSMDSVNGKAKTIYRLLVSRREAAVQLSISERAIDYLIANKALTARRIGSRVLIPTQDLQRFARADHPEPLAS